MLQMPPAPEELARWLLIHEARDNPSPEVFAAAAERVHARLRASLSVFLGPTGFDSLWARAMHLSPTISGGAAPTGDESPAALPAVFRTVVTGSDAAEVHAGLIADVASFIALLFTFVGATLGLRLMRHVWPELPVGGPSTQPGDVTP
jgi:hypothetical protein